MRTVAIRRLVCETVRHTTRHRMEAAAGKAPAIANNGGDNEVMRNLVKNTYGEIAKATADGALERKEKLEMTEQLAMKFGYTAEELSSLPEGANQGLSCGNPVATASLRPGEVVLDLGSGIRRWTPVVAMEGVLGGGLDVFLAAKLVGSEGKAIGIDMSPEMISLARRNAERGGRHKVEFHLSPIESMPLEDASVDCVISNCVLNLCPDKPAAFREICRVVKPGGRLAISDIVLKKAIPLATWKEEGVWEALAGKCIAGAIPQEDYVQGLRDAGFTDVSLLNKNSDLNIWKDTIMVDASAPAEAKSSAGCCGAAAPAATSCCGGAAGAAPAAPSLDPVALQAALDKYDLNEYAASVYVFASR